MALKADRVVSEATIDFQFLVAAEAGQVAIYATQAAGHASGQGINELAPQATLQGTGTPASGTRIIGLLLTDVENIYSYALLADGSPASGLAAGVGDPILVRIHRNYQKTTQIVGEPVAILKQGTVWTNQITGTPTAGDPAYLAASSKLSTTQTNNLPQVGRFDTVKDANGYAKVSVLLV